MGTPLKSPPVYFTVVQARFNTLLKLGDYLASIQEGMRKAGFPDFTSRKMVTLQLAAQEVQVTPPNVVNLEQFLFGNAHKTHMFVLNPDALTLQSTRYGQFEDFSAQFLEGLALVDKVVQLDFTDRVGLRYLDHVAPRPNDRLDLYVVPEVRGLGARLGGKTVHAFSETFSHLGDIQLRSRVLIQDGGLAFPPDLAADGMQIDDRFLEYSGHHATLDTDGFIERRMPFSASAVGEQLNAIHGVISAAFKAAVTEYAFKVWDEV
ncbi:TIGR04255 family protein [Bradyrhizobium sp. SZCCHNS2005]|uniref:TIGR04255 family protein n=1 Tax=Bradyrhizobium sp. SZCCHNS2005 TaxID=3057303 RepID=UPI0028EE02EF|nr:TIGR04255 family protein [Bradyrhizobium sp. SZCCHNS2005]